MLLTAKVRTNQEYAITLGKQGMLVYLAQKEKGETKEIATLPMTKLKLMQLNVNRSRGAHDLLYASAIQAQVDVLIVSEPNRRVASGEMWRTDEDSDCAIVILSGEAVLNSGCGHGYVWVDLGDMRVFSCYFSPNRPLRELEGGLENLSRAIETGRRKVIVGGDFNAKSPEWGGAFEDNRGSLLADWATTQNLHCLNSGTSPTFERGTYGSVLDVTFSTECLARNLCYWRVLQKETLSDHRCIEMCFTVLRRESAPPVTGWKVDESGKARLEIALG